MPSTATERVRAAIIAGKAPARKDVEHALRATLGLSARQAKRFASEGCRALGNSAEDDLAELVERMKALESIVKSG